MLNQDELKKRKKPSPFQGAIKRRLKAYPPVAPETPVKKTTSKSSTDSGEFNDAVHGTDELEITKRRKRLGY